MERYKEIAQANQEQPIEKAVCTECGNPIYEDEFFWVDEEGNRFCCAECACEYHGIV